jgi:hypothetical protein
MQGEGARAAQYEVQLVRGGRALECGPTECRLGRSQGRNPITTGRRGRDSLQAANKGESDPRCGMPYPRLPVLGMRVLRRRADAGQRPWLTAAGGSMKHSSSSGGTHRSRVARREQQHDARRMPSEVATVPWSVSYGQTQVT